MYENILLTFSHINLKVLDVDIFPIYIKYTEDVHQWFQAQFSVKHCSTVRQMTEKRRETNFVCNLTRFLRNPFWQRWKCLISQMKSLKKSVIKLSQLVGAWYRTVIRVLTNLRDITLQNYYCVWIWHGVSACWLWRTGHFECHILHRRGELKILKLMCLVCLQFAWDLGITAGRWICVWILIWHWRKDRLIFFLKPLKPNDTVPTYCNPFINGQWNCQGILSGRWRYGLHLYDTLWKSVRWKTRVYEQSSTIDDLKRSLQNTLEMNGIQNNDAPTWCL